ncbi:Hypothetical protein ING2D1G_0228 [Peptoniphilus sp. ING2-D1G]|nr:Hypothetical protein ING2D1G_0228 [Peptoniphilus sp. ING2-D1G]
MFKKKRKDDTIYGTILESEKSNSIDELIFDETENKDDDISGLIKAFEDFYDRNSESIEEFDKYFENHRADCVIDKFLNYLYNIEIFNEQKLVGLSILLMRNTHSVESVKFGIILSGFYPLINVRGALKIIVDLAIHEEFSEYSFKAIKTLQIYPVLRDNILRRSGEKVHRIEERINEIRKK